MCRIRAVLILCVALAYAGAPLALDACARACASAGPACHHASPAAAHIGHPPDLCGNEHDAVRSSLPNAKSSRIAGAAADLASTQPIRPGHLLVREHPRVASPPLTSRPSAAFGPLRV
jgi:hypothetical protein